MKDINEIIKLAINVAKTDIKTYFMGHNNECPINLCCIDTAEINFRPGSSGGVVGEMHSLNEGYEIDLMFDTMLSVVSSNISWEDHCSESPEEFASIQDEDVRILAIIVETIYHEFRHIISAERLYQQGKSYNSQYALEDMSNGYWNNKFERSARAFQRKCMITLNKFIEDGKLKED